MRRCQRFPMHSFSVLYAAINCSAALHEGWQYGIFLGIIIHLDEGVVVIDGIYIGFMAGQNGNGLAMFVFLDGVISGSDAAGVTFDGRYDITDERCSGVVTVFVPGQITVVQGASAGPSGMSYDVKLEMPLDFTEQDFQRIETPLGPVNLKLKKLRSLGNV